MPSQARSLSLIGLDWAWPVAHVALDVAWSGTFQPAPDGTRLSCVPGAPSAGGEAAGPPRQARGGVWEQAQRHRCGPQAGRTPPVDFGFKGTFG